MKAIKESFTVVMSPDERDAMVADISRVHGFLEDYFRGKEVENDGSPDCKLMDTMSSLEHFMRVLEGATFA